MAANSRLSNPPPTVDLRLSRRSFIGAGVAMAGSTASGAWAASEPRQAARGRLLVPRNRLGVQQWAVRDAITRANRSQKGYLGGPTFPDNPSDLGPLVALPGGFAAVFAHLASLGYKGFEFFSFDQGDNGPITAPQIRAALVAAGMVAAGSHTGGLSSMVDPAYRRDQIRLAYVLGYRMIGTASNPLPGDPPSGLLADWQQAALDANAVGAALKAEGLKYFFHPEQDWFRFFSDPAHPELDRVHRIDWFTDNTDPELVFFEPDTMHTLAGRARFPDPVDGRLFDVNAWYERLSDKKRIIAWHAKDADRIVPLPGPGISPFTQTRSRPGFGLNGGVDVVYVGEGSVSQGYPVDPDPQVLGYAKMFDRYELGQPGWFHTESDEGPGPAGDAGRSLRWAKVSARSMLDLRAIPGGPDCAVGRQG